MSISERFKSTMAAPAQAKAFSAVALIVAFIAIGISFGVLLSVRGASNAR